MESPTKPIECECETMDKPVDFLGDTVCKHSPTNVREIIKKYEPEHEHIKQAGSLGLITSQRSSLSRSLNRVVFEETQASPMRAVTQQPVVKQLITNRSVEKTKSGSSRRSSIGGVSKNKSNLSNVSKRSNVDSGLQQGGPAKDSTYKSKTTITKTAQGVRITTDILFNSTTRESDQWVGRRIDTDLPDSKILTDFESKNSPEKNTN